MLVQNSPYMVMPRALRPVHRSPRRSRRRQLALACAMLSYLAVFAAGVLALLSLVGSTGHVAVLSLELAGVLAVGGLVLWVVDAVVGPEPPGGGRARLSG